MQYAHMGKTRVSIEGESWHCTSRCVDGKFFFRNDRVKEVIRKMMRNLAIVFDIKIGTLSSLDSKAVAICIDAACTLNLNLNL